MEGRELQHIFHEHPLLLKDEVPKYNGDNDLPDVEIICDGCRIPISGPFYSCGECRYFLHKVCAELPSSLDHPKHPEHSLALLECSPYAGYYYCDLCNESRSGFVYHCSVCSFDLDIRCAFSVYKIKDKCHPHPLTPVQVMIAITCHICGVDEKGLFYKCDICPFLVHQNCTTEHSNFDHPYPFRGLQHLFHMHPLILKAEQSKNNGGIDHPQAEIKCDGCRMAILGPFYRCEECPYFLHKVCAELPSKLNHPLHPEHPLILSELTSDVKSYYDCILCKEDGYCVDGSMFTYLCSICTFSVDMKCASATHMILDKCHPHPLTPIQTPIPFACHICQKTEEGLSYKCNSCPFWVHQNCTLLPDVVKHSDHSHLLKLLPSVPFKYELCRKCDICHGNLFMFLCNYSCVSCLFFSHVNCARSEIMESPSRDQSLVLLPMKQDSTDLISRFVRNYIDGDANIDDKINHFDHMHPLFLIDEKMSDKTCEACAIPISHPSYGCVDCDYYLHKCCNDLPKQISHPLHPEHQLVLRCNSFFIQCKWSRQICNSFFYVCSECEDFVIDIKCASLQENVYYEAHRHPLIPKINSLSTCTGCSFESRPKCILKCDTCRLVLCFMCAMAPPVIKHRYGKSEPFTLTYSAPENHDDEYICELCQKELNPKHWFYHCVFADQFIHRGCMLNVGFDSNIKYGKSVMYKNFHQHMLTTISSTYDCSPCTVCREPMRNSLASVGLECKTCNFRRHLQCPDESLPE